MINGLYGGLSTVSAGLETASGGAGQIASGVESLNENYQVAPVNWLKE